MSANRFGDLLREQRTRAGKTLGDLARELGVSVTFVSDVERGRRAPLSAARMSKAFAFLDVPDVQAQQMRVAAAQHAKKISLALPSTEKGQMAGAALQRGWELLDDNDWDKIMELVAAKKKPGDDGSGLFMTADWFVVSQSRQSQAARRPRGFRADRGGLSYVEIERAANHARPDLAPTVTFDQPLPGISLFERLERFYVSVDGEDIHFTYGVEELPLGVEAKTVFEGHHRKICMVLSEQTYADLERNTGRARHTLFHEIGHGALHTSQLIRMSTIPHDTMVLARGMNHKFYEDTEWQADAYAAALAMPGRGLSTLQRQHGQLTPKTISTRFQVSLEAAANRINTVTGRPHLLTM